MTSTRVLAGSLALLLLAASPAYADRRDQKAADLYSDGVALIKKGKFKEGAQKLNEALARGATEPNEQQGSESRALVRRYDPYYWLGVAQMEMGQEEQALLNFEKSETTLPKGATEPVIKKWKDEWADLQARKKTLEAKLAGPATQPTPTALIAVARPTATPVVVAVVVPTARPTEPPPPTAAPATPTAFAIVVPTAVVAAGAPTPVPENPVLAALRELRGSYQAWLAEPKVGAAVRSELAPRLDALARTLSAPKLPADAALARQLQDERRYFEKSAAPALRRASLTAGVEALAGQRWDDAQRFAQLARKAEPKAPQADVLECAVLATRYVVDQKSDPLTIQRARERLRDWRAKVGQSRELPPFLSPALREVLQ